MSKDSNSGRLKHRNRQRLSRRTLIILCMFGILVLSGITGVIYFIQTGETKAAKDNKFITRTIEDQEFTNEFSLAQPVINPSFPDTRHTVFVKKLKKSTGSQTLNE
jgi:hypothetical protein